MKKMAVILSVLTAVMLVLCVHGWVSFGDALESVQTEALISENSTDMVGEDETSEARYDSGDISESSPWDSEFWESGPWDSGPWDSEFWESSPPITDPPITDPPITDPPITDPPITDPPITDPPITVPPTAYERYREAVDHLQNADTIEATASMTATTVIGRYTATVLSTLTLRATGLMGSNPVSRTVMMTELPGATVTEDVYAEKGWLYYTVEDGCYKIKVEPSDPVGNLMGAWLSEELFAEAVISEDGDRLTMTLMLTGEAFLTCYPELAERLSAEKPLTVEDVKDVSVSYTVNGEGQFTSMTMAYTVITQDAANGRIERRVSQTVTLFKLGQDVTVEAPPGYASYPTSRFA